MKCVKTIPELGVPPHAAHPGDVSHAWLGSTEMRFRSCVERAELTGALPALAVLLSPSSGWEKCYTAEQKHTVVALSVSQQPLQMDFLCILVSACCLWDVFMIDLCDTAHFGHCNDAFKHRKGGKIVRFLGCEILSLSKIGPVQVNARYHIFASFMLNWIGKYPDVLQRVSGPSWLALLHSNKTPHIFHHVGSSCFQIGGYVGF